MILLLVRHAVTGVTGKKLSGRLPGIPLSREGREDAAGVAKRLAEAPLKAVYSSPVDRCVETAEAIAAHHPLKVEAIEALAEVDYGQWQGKSMKMLYRSKGWSQLKARPADFRFPGGETIREAQTRAMGAIEALRQQHKGDTVAVCSHADVIRLLVAGYLGLAIDLYSRISIAPCSVTAIILEDATPHLVRLGDTGSLEGLQTPAAGASSGKGRRRSGSPAGAAKGKASARAAPTVPLEGN